MTTGKEPPPGRAALSPSQLTALRNLDRKRAGQHVEWINIAAARALTDLGLAERTREGWNITPEGASMLAAFGADHRD